MTIKSIVIIGSSIEAWLPAAYIRARLPSAYKISIIETSKSKDENRLIARPNSKDMHALLQFSEADLGQHAQAKPLLAATINADIALPFGRYGLDRDGAEFQHLWRRIYPDTPIQNINLFNLSLALQKAALFIPQAPQGMPSYDYGYDLSTNGYLSMLKQAAKDVLNLEAKKLEIHHDSGKISAIDCGDTHIQADLYIDATRDGHVSNIISTLMDNWHGNCLSICRNFDETDHKNGIRLYRLQKAMERLIALWPDTSFAPSELNEYNRLANAEQEHIRDMNALLAHDKKEMSNRKALQRKIAVFESRGRIANEDYEIFSKSEWIAALAAANISPASYDRLADRADEHDLKQWIKQLEQAIGQYVHMMGQRTIKSSPQSHGNVTTDGNIISNISGLVK